MARIAHSSMTAEEVTENIVAAVQTAMAKIKMVSQLTGLCFRRDWCSQLKEIHCSVSLNDDYTFSRPWTEPYYSQILYHLHKLKCTTCSQADNKTLIHLLTCSDIMLCCCLQKGPVIKIIHIKSQSSVALPIYTSDLSHIKVFDKSEKSKAKVTASLSSDLCVVLLGFVEMTGVCWWISERRG